MGILSLTLEQHFEVLKHSIIPVLSALALSKAAEYMINKLPINNAKKRLLNEMEENSVVIFECGPESEDGQSK